MTSFSLLNPTLRGILLMILAVFTFTLMDALAKSLMQHNTTVQVIWARYTGQSVIVVALVAHRFRSVFRTRHPWLHLLRSTFQFGASALFFSSLNWIGLAEATAIIDVNPVLITLGAALLLNEKIGPRRMVGVGAALIGALIIIRPGSGIFSPAALLPLAGAFCYAGYAILTRLVGRDEDVWTSLFYTAAFGTVVTTAMLPWHWQPVAPADVAGFVAIGVIGAGAQLCLIRSFTLAEAGAVAPFGYVGLLFATVWGFIFFGEVPDFWTGVGALVIVSAGIYVWHREMRAAQVHHVAPAAAG